MSPAFDSKRQFRQSGAYVLPHAYSGDIANAREWWLFNEVIGHWFVRNYVGGGAWLCECVECRTPRELPLRLDQGHDPPACSCGATTGRAEFLAARAEAKAKNEARMQRAKYIKG